MLDYFEAICYAFDLVVDDWAGCICMTMVDVFGTAVCIFGQVSWMVLLNSCRYAVRFSIIYCG